MAFRVRMKDGGVFTLKADTLGEALEQIREHVLTGSLSASAEVWLETREGGAVRYSDVQRFEKDNDDA